MKRQLLLLTFFILGFCFIAFDACHVSSKRVSISGVPKLDPAANIVVNGLNSKLGDCSPEVFEVEKIA